jgi:S-adenosylmethionine:tRNA ribosyltransferase-isomerase
MSDSKTPVADYDFDLPEGCIAQYPAQKRGASKLLTVDRLTGELSDCIFSDIADMLDENSFLVVNSTKVMKARLFGVKPTGGQIEILVLEKISDCVCLAITKGRVRAGMKAAVGDVTAYVDEITQDGSRIIRFEGCSVTEVMDRYGHLPLPPYITREDSEADAERYQTIYSKEEGSVAAPTAGLHFTPEIMELVSAKGVRVIEITLNIGIGTFRPVKADFLEDHDMHTEKYYISEASADEINRLKSEGKKLTAVGTTAVRALESACVNGQIKAGYGETNLFIRPGYEFKIVDKLITNFHLPKSTLFVLVSQFAGREKMLKAYTHAKESGYRFFSYGDAMYIK